MSDKCGNCDCSDKTQCVKNGTGAGYAAGIVVTETSYANTVMMENDGKCKCGANCSCTNCTCGH